MKKKFGDIIRKNDKLFYLALMMKRMKNAEFRKKVIEIEKDYSKVLLQKSEGIQSDYSMIYVIEVGSPTIGFFALMRLVLNSLVYADYFGLSPVVIYKPEVSYQEEYEFQGTKNAFEYYFQQTTQLPEDTIQFLKNQRSYLKSIPEHYTQTFRMVGLSEVQDYLIRSEHYECLASAMRKYLKFQPYVEQMLKKDIEHLKISESVIGVHYRGTDFKNNYGSHPVAISVEDYISEIKKLPEKYCCMPIFLATDDVEAMDEFRAAFGERMCCYSDVERAVGNQSVICSQSKRENHHFLLGYEVLRDMYTLSKCGVLVAGLSQVSIFARISKMSRNEKYQYDVVMSKGINRNNKSHVKDIMRERNRKK